MLAEKEDQIAAVLLSLGDGPLSKKQVEVASRLLGIHWVTLYRLRKRFIMNPFAKTLARRKPGSIIGCRRLDRATDEVIDKTFVAWIAGRFHETHTRKDLGLEVRRNCLAACVHLPSFATVTRRWLDKKKRDAFALAERGSALIAPGQFEVQHALDVVQVDHTQADVLLVDEVTRKVIGRPWLSVALDVATRSVLAVYVAMERPNSSTVGLLLTRVVFPKFAWLSAIGVDTDWPMHGLPDTLHLDNAAEFKSRALRSGCRDYSIKLSYRPVGRPHFGGHIERLNRTLMDRVHSLPGSTGPSPKGRKKNAPEKSATLTLREFEQWLALEIAGRYHHSPHQGLRGASPVDTWNSFIKARAPRKLPPIENTSMAFLIQFLPIARRKIQADGLTLFHIRYWHPIFVAWRVLGVRVTVRYHPENLSRIFVSCDGGEVVEARYADLRRPPITLFEQRSALRAIRAAGRRDVSEMHIFVTIESQRQVIAASKKEKQKAITGVPKRSHKTSAKRTSPSDTSATELGVDYNKSVVPFDVEQW